MILFTSMKLIMENWKRFLLEQQFYDRDYEKRPLTDDDLELLDQEDDDGVNARLELIAYIVDNNDSSMLNASSKLGPILQRVRRKVVSLAKSQGSKISSLRKRKQKSAVSSTPVKTVKKRQLKQKQGYQGYEGNNPDAYYEENPNDKKLNKNCWINLFAHYTFNGDDVPYGLLKIENSSRTNIVYGFVDEAGNRKSNFEMLSEILEDLLPELEEDENGTTVGLGNHDGTYGFRRRWDRLEGNSTEYSTQYSFCPLDKSIASNRNLFAMKHLDVRYIPVPLNGEYRVFFAKKNRNRNSPRPVFVDLSPLAAEGPGNIATAYRPGGGASQADARIPILEIDISTNYGNNLKNASQEDLDNMANDARFGLRNISNSQVGFEGLSKAQIQNLIRASIGR